MALDSSILEQDILKNIRDEMKSIDSDAQPRDYQEALAKAMAESIVKLLKGPAKGVGSAGSATTGQKVKEISVQESLMTKVAFNTFKKKYPQATDITRRFFKAVSKAVKDHLKEAEAFSVSGFGGQISAILGFDPKGKVLFAMVKKAMPSRFTNGRAGLPFIEALSAGISTGILDGKVPSELPQTYAYPPAGPVGPVIAKFS